MGKLLCVGEILIDLTQTGVTETGIPQFNANPGGAPANVAVAAARLGADARFIGCVGKDAFGKFLHNTLRACGVNVDGLQESADAPTTLAVVSVDASGDRSFQFYRKPGADLYLDQNKFDLQMLKDTAVLHFGSVSLTAEPSRTATLSAAKEAKKYGALITYDPNYRDTLWQDEQTAIVAMRKPLPMVDILKISDEETELLSGYSEPERAAEVLEQQGIALVLVTLGADGVLYRFRGKSGRVPGFATEVADTNGAGDTFFGAVLSCLPDDGLEHLTEERLREILRFANCAASITTSRPGAIPAMPNLDEVKIRLQSE